MGGLTRGYRAHDLNPCIADSLAPARESAEPIFNLLRLFWLWKCGQKDQGSICPTQTLELLEEWEDSVDVRLAVD
ncbi:hypothetical protein OUZ56_003738 [Daphnia magna]|uniref:Uncharacterized protein n=1 Tax=Daphnia magna TaxID=35525 RepID=A0ABR0A9L0_9CRUS|nr:hypothetical protein OUZ56_003738 [Daphnia magna]